jgi:hypothetical protein
VFRRSRQKKLEVLLLCIYDTTNAQTVRDHIDALRFKTGHRVRILSGADNFPSDLDLARFDVVIIHYGLVLSSELYVSASTREKLRQFAGVKIVFVQDEYRWVNRTIQALNYIRADALFTCVPEKEIEKVYAAAATPTIKKVNTLTGYVPANLLRQPVLDYRDRPVEVGYRGRKLSGLFGETGQLKWTIVPGFLEAARPYQLACDLSYLESDRLYGSEWVEFLRSCRAVLGVESGTDVFDFTDELRQEIYQFEAENPDAPFASIQEKFLSGHPHIIPINQISPRCFEAAAMRCLMILYEGEYSGVLEPWRHYVPLKKDHSNIAEVVAVLRDQASWRSIVDCAYNEVACNPAWSYDSFADRVGQEMKSVFAQKGLKPCTPYSDFEFWLIQRWPPLKERLTAYWEAWRWRLHNANYVFLNRLPRPVYLALRYVWRLVRPKRQSPPLDSRCQEIKQ